MAAKGVKLKPLSIQHRIHSMSTAIKLDDALVESARIYGEASHRSTPKQIEHWATVGRIAEQNPDLPYDFIVGLLRARAQVKAGDVSEYKFG